MRIAFLSDIHANLPALRAALDTAAANGADRVVIAGDLIGDGPFPSETVQFIRDSGITEVIRGNVDRKVLRVLRRRRKKLEKLLRKADKKIRNRVWTALALSEDDREWLSTLPAELTFEAEGCSVLVVHGSPYRDTDYIYPSLTPEALERKLEPYTGTPPMVLACGHSHVPFTGSVAGTLVVNCGSVGRPADGDSRGSLAIVEFTAGEPPKGEIVRFPYAFDELCEAIERRVVPGIRAEQYRQGVKGRVAGRARQIHN